MIPGIMPVIVGAESRGPAVLIDRTAGAIVTDFTLRTNAAFDGITNQGSSAAAVKTGGPATAFLGKTFSIPTALDTVIVYGSNNTGFFSGAADTITINVRGKNGTPPSSSTDGTVLGSLSFTRTSDESAGRTIVTADKTYFDHVFIELDRSVVSTGGAFCAEIVMYGWQ